MCRNIFEMVRGKLDCPIRVYPHCHPRAHLEVFAVAKNRTIILSCSRCDRPIAVIRTRHTPRNHKK